MSERSDRRTDVDEAGHERSPPAVDAPRVSVRGDLPEHVGGCARREDRRPCARDGGIPNRRDVGLPRARPRCGTCDDVQLVEVLDQERGGQGTDDTSAAIRGRRTSSGTATNTIYEYDVATNAWSGPLTVAGTAPIARNAMAFAYDPIGNRCILQGGSRTPFPNCRGDCWQYAIDPVNGPTWTLLVADAAGAGAGGTTGDPGLRWVHRMVYDSGRTRLVLYGGSPCWAERPDHPGLPLEKVDLFCELIRARWGGALFLEEMAPSRVDDEPYRAWWARHLRTAVAPAMATRARPPGGVAAVCSEARGLAAVVMASRRRGPGWGSCRCGTWFRLNLRVGRVRRLNTS